MNFGTCTADYDGNDFAGYSQVNYDIFSLFTSGRDQILGARHTLECAETQDTIDKISSLMLIPLLQGVQRYLYKTSVSATPTAKEAGELFAFASVVLPFIHNVDPDAAEMLYNRAWNLHYTTDDWSDIKYAIEDTYPSLGVGAGLGVVTCSMVGELTDAGVVLSEMCIDASGKDSMDIPIWVLIVIGSLFILTIITCGYGIHMRKKWKETVPLIDQGFTKDFQTKF